MMSFKNKNLMKKKIQLLKIASSIAAFLAINISCFAQELPTTGSINTSIGKLSIKNGYPTEQTSRD